MKQISLEIPDSEYAFFLKLMKSLKFIKNIEDSPSKTQLLNEIREGIIELKLIEQGKLKGRPAKDSLNEL